MSTYWGYKCIDCDQESSDEWFNHGDEKLTACVELWEHIKIINNSMWLSVELLGGNYDVFQFLEQHEGHDIKLHNEYGHIKDIQ